MIVEVWKYLEMSESTVLVCFYDYMDDDTGWVINGKYEVQCDKENGVVHMPQVDQTVKAIYLGDTYYSLFLEADYHGYEPYYMKVLKHFEQHGPIGHNSAVPAATEKSDLLDAMERAYHDLTQEQREAYGYG